MLIAAALIELSLPEADSIKAKRRVVRSIVDRLRSAFNVSISEIDDQDDRHSICLGCVTVGSDPIHIKERMTKAVRAIERLGLAELVSDDICVVSLDEVEELEPDEPDPDGELPGSWGEE